MASLNKTKKLKLNAWTSSDKPTMDDFNQDNNKIDEWAGEVDTRLEKKVDTTTSLQWISAQLREGFKHISGLFFSKDNAGNVSINGTIGIDYKFDFSGKVLCILPEGYRPLRSQVFPIVSGNLWSTYLWVTPTGEIKFALGANSERFMVEDAMGISIYFLSIPELE